MDGDRNIEVLVRMVVRMKLKNQRHCIVHGTTLQLRLVLQLVNVKCGFVVRGGHPTTTNGYCISTNKGLTDICLPWHLPGQPLISPVSCPNLPSFHLTLPIRDLSL